jgi:hypothetical protein
LSIREVLRNSFKMISYTLVLYFISYTLDFYSKYFYTFLPISNLYWVKF